MTMNQLVAFHSYVAPGDFFLLNALVSTVHRLSLAKWTLKKQNYFSNKCFGRNLLIWYINVLQNCLVTCKLKIAVSVPARAYSADSQPISFSAFSKAFGQQRWIVPQATKIIYMGTLYVKFTFFVVRAKYWTTNLNSYQLNMYALPRPSECMNAKCLL